MSVTLPFPFSMDTAAFVVVDMQNDFVRSDAPMGVPDALATIKPIQRVQALFRERGRPVVYTRFVAGQEPSLLWTWSPQIREPVNCCRLGHRRYYEDIGAERECVAVIDELQPQPGESVIDKFWYSAFFRTNLEDILHSYGADTVVISGTVSHICVEDTAHHAFHHGFKTILLRDGVSSFDPQLHEAALKNIAMKYGAVITAGELLELVG